MKFKRLLSVFAAAAVAATTITIPAAADSAAAPTVLFSDDFDSGYASGIFERHTSGDNYTNLIGTDFKVSNAIGISEAGDFFYPNTMAKSGNADKVFVMEESSGIGSGKALNVTTQAGLNSCSWMIKNSGIDAENISGKELTFTADFMVPSDNGFNWGNGAIVYLDEKGSGHNMPTTRWSFAGGTDWAYMSDTLKSKTLLGIESEQYAKTPCAFAFGEKLADIEVGKAYSYKLILTPNGEGGYTAKAEINGVIREFSGTNLPTVEKMAGYQFAMIAEKANPYFINANYSENNKYQNDKTIALLDNLCFTASEPAPESDTLFSDDFSGYTGEYIAKAEQNKLEYYDSNSFVVRNNVASGQWTAKINDVDTVVVSRSEHPERIAKLVDGVLGSTEGKSLQLTSQGLVVNGSIYKLSNITETKIGGKALVFSAKFLIPSEGMYNRGVGFAAGLSPVNSDETAPDAVCTDVNHQISENYIKPEYKLFAAQGTDFYVFGEKQWELRKDVEYSYTLKLYPNGDGTYKAAATLNGDEIIINSANIPTAAQLKDYKYAFVALHNHGWYTYSNSEKNADGTSKYANDMPLVYMDDISLERKDPSEVTMPKADEPLTDEELGAYGLFNADFEDYSAEYVKKATSDELAQYEKNSFVLNNGAKTVVPGKYGDLDGNDGRIEEGDISKLFKIVKNGGFGSGSNYLSIQSQGLIAGGTMWTRSNITPARINNKTLKFNAKFKIPSDGKWGNGRGAAIIFADAAADGTKPNGAISSVDMNVNDLNSKYSLATVFYYDGAAKLGVFGENIGDVEIGKVYEVTVTMVPNAEGKYTVTAKLNDTEKVLEGKKIVDGVETETVPTMSELENYAFIGVVGHTVAYNTIATSDTENDKYLKDKDLIWFDDISLKRANNFVLDETKGINGISDLTSDGEIDMAKKYITLNLGENITAADLSKITIDNGATVKAAEIDSTDSKKLKITFDGLKLSADYKISVAGIVNPLGIEYSQVFSLRTSAGIDVDYTNIKLENGTDGKMKVTVPVTKAAGVTETVKPAIIVSVYDESAENEPMLKKSYVKEDEVTTQTSIEITGIDVEAGDKVRVFVWDGFTTMIPLTQRVDLQ